MVTYTCGLVSTVLAVRLPRELSERGFFVASHGSSFATKMPLRICSVKHVIC
jgi:hypothetical protein